MRHYKSICAYLGKADVQYTCEALRSRWYVEYRYDIRHAVLWFSLAACLVLHLVAPVTAFASEIRWNIVNAYMLHETSKFRLILFLGPCRTFIDRVKRWGGALADVWPEPELFMCVIFVYVCIFIWGIVPCLPPGIEMAVVDGSEGFSRLMLKVNDIPWLTTWPCFLPVRLHNHDGVFWVSTVRTIRSE